GCGVQTCGGGVGLSTRGAGAGGGRVARYSSLHAVAVAEGRARRDAPRKAGGGEGATAARDPPTPGAGARACALAGGARPPKKSHPVLGHTKADAFAFIDTQRGQHAVTRLCALYGVTRAGYYAWRRRPVSDHAAQDRELERRIQRLFQQHRGTYGSPRIHRALHAEGCTVSRRRVARLMRTAGLRARVVQIYRANPRLHRFYGQHPNRVWARVATRPDQIWVGDITYLPVGGRWRFLADPDLIGDRKSTRLNSSHEWISYAVFCLKKKTLHSTSIAMTW